MLNVLEYAGGIIHGGFGDSASAERSGRAGLAFGDLGDFGVDAAGWICCGVRDCGWAVSFSASGIQSAANRGVVCESRSAAGDAGLFRAYVGAVRDVDVVRSVFCG